jgi:GNAT superfamily N-acetyltransferase
MKSAAVVEEVESFELHELRRNVLRGGDFTVSVEDPRDGHTESMHLAVRMDGAVVVAGSFYSSTSPVNPNQQSMQLRYLATNPVFQRQGLGAMLLRQAEARLIRRGVDSLWANARDTALSFYLREGWEAVPDSEHLSPETQLPHTVIVKQLLRQTP